MRKNIFDIGDGNNFHRNQVSQFLHFVKNRKDLYTPKKK